MPTNNYPLDPNETLREYVVTVYNFDDLESLYVDLENSGTGQHDVLPDRAVDCHLRRPVSRNTHYWLTDSEAVVVAADPRVRAVELTPEEQGLICGPLWTQTSSQWSKSSSLSVGDLNWGLYRIFNGSQVTAWGFDGTQNISGTVTVSLSGANVDVVIVDGMLDPAHPEFAVNSNGTGGSRVVQYNWYGLNTSVTGGSPDTYPYLIDPANGDYQHGHHVAGVAVGNTHGWARGANIYNISPGFIVGGIINTYVFDYIKVWHQTKSVNPSTGVKNPTICNNSWGYYYSTPRTNVTSVTYRGTTTTKSFTQAELNALGIWVDASDNAVMPARNSAVDADVEDLIAAGVIVVGAAGNSYTKMDVPGGVDYDNTLDYSGFTITPFQGSSPTAATGSINVGSTGAGVTGGADRKASYSNCGPRVDIWAPGTYINSSWPGSTTAIGGPTPVVDTRNTSYYVGKISGTSMASPQVTGVLACLLERFPTSDQATVRTTISATLVAAGQIPTYTGGPADYFDLQGAPNSHIRWVDIGASTSSDATLSGLTISAGTLSPAFDPYTTSYTNTVTNSQASVNISASTAQTTSTLTLNGSSWNGTASAINLNTGSNATTIVVTAPDATTTKSYSVDIIRLTAPTPPNNSPTYSIVPDTTVVNEGSTITYTISTTNVVDGTTLYWTNAGTTAAGDFTDTSNSGSLTVTGGSATLTRTLLNDTATEGTETVLIQLRAGSTSGGVVASADSVAVIDSSTGASGQYNIFPSTRFLIRGNSITFTVRTSGLSDNTFLFWSNIGTSTGADFVGGQNSGQFLITNNQGSFTIQLLDIVSNGSKTIIIQLRSVSSSGTVVATSDITIIYDHGLIIQASDYNTIFTTVNRLMGKNSLGYGAALRSTSTSIGKIITTSSWLDTISDLQKCSIHQVGSVNTPLVTIGNTIFNHGVVRAVDVGGVNEAAQVLYTNSGTVHASQLTSITSTPNSSSSSWTTSTSTNIGFTWRDIADVNYFFNLGSVVKPQLSVSGAEASLWQSLVNQANLVTFSKPEFYATSSYFRTYSSGGRTLSIAYGVAGTQLIASAVFSTSTANITAISQFAATYSVDTLGGIAAPVPSVQVINGSLTVSPNPIPIITTKANELALVTLTFTNNTDQPCTITSINNINNALIFSHSAMPVTIPANSSVALPITYQCGISALYQDQILVQSSLGQVILPTVIKVNLNVYSSPDNNWTLYNVTVDDLLGKKFTFNVDGGGYTIDAFSKTGTNASQFTISQDTPLDVSAFFDPKIQINGLHTMNIVTRVVPTDPNIDIINVTVPVSITTNIVNQHLGSWLGPQSRANSAIGMSYDIIGGRRTLTVGFGTDQGRNQQSFGLYGAMKMLGVLGNSNTSIIGYPYQDAEYGTFINTYGVWSSPGGAGTGAWDTTGIPITFYVNTSGTYNWEYSSDNEGVLYIDGAVVADQPYGTGFTDSITGTVTLGSGAHTVSWNVYNSGGPGSVGFRLYNAANNTDVWSTLSIAPKWGNWYDVFRIPLTGQPATLYSSPTYQIQSTNWYNGNTISSYFGAGTSAGSIVTVNDDGLGNLGILLNSVGSKPGDEGEFDITVGDTTYAFNYADGLSNRYFNLEEPIGDQTRVFKGFDQNGNVQTALVTYNPAPSGGGGNDFPWWIVLVPFIPGVPCFIEDTLVDMADGTQKRIIDVEEGELVFNHDKTSVNLVTLTECDITQSKYTLYSPKAGMEPFATVNHPLIIDGIMYAFDPDTNYEMYPWLGKNEKLVTDKIVETDQKVYSLWVTGDETFRVNGYGTHSIFGAGGGLLDCYQRKVLTKEEVLQMRQKFVDYGNNAIYGGYLYNNFLAWANIKLLTDCSAAILKSDKYPVLEKIIMAGMKAIGMAARTWKKLSKGK